MDGTDLRDFDTGTLRSQISVVFQDYRRYYTTVRENIWLGDIGRPLDDERIIQAAKYSDIHRTVKRLKEGYDTQMGKWLENGEELSFGQLQKLAVARGLFRDGQVMILDEPTSAMDAKSEFEVFKRFQEMARGRTIILISHRLSTLRMADSIYVMKEGRIVERGSHQDLIRQGGTYADLFEIQARAYR
jgi:ATP-binding cassette subfamily B protein